MRRYQRNGASVANITSLAVVPTRQGQTVQPQGVGSGFILDTDGRIVTNNHVVQDADQLAVSFQDKTTVPAKLVGRDPDNPELTSAVVIHGVDEGLRLRGTAAPDDRHVVLLIDSS